MFELPESTRREFLKHIGFISVGFPLLISCMGQEDPVMAPRETFEGNLPGSMRRSNKVNAWLHVLDNGQVRVLSGKVELGQGIRTAIRQVAAEELDMKLDQVEVHLAETGFTPDEGYTAGSNSVPSSVMSVRYAAATARQKLLDLANELFMTSIDDLILFDGKVKSKKLDESLSFVEILNGRQIEMQVTTPIQIKSKAEHRYVGKAIPRNDIAKMVSGEEVYIQDLRFPGMLHARVVRPPGYHTKLKKIDTSGLEAEVSGVVKIHVEGSFIGVITEREFQAVKAERFLKEQAEWESGEELPPQNELFQFIRRNADAPQNIREEGNVTEGFKGKEVLKSTFTKPYIAHGSMGPACAIAILDIDTLHVWSHSQGIYPMRRALAAMLELEEEKIHVVSVPGAGCYGHSTADDAAADAAVLAMSMPGKYIRVQWSRQDENTWDPYGSAMIMEVEASLDESGKINGWKSEVWTDSHSTRPNNDAGTLITARYLEDPKPMRGRGYLGGGHRNADPYYSIPNMQLKAHYFDGPLRVSSLRSLGAYTTIFAVESFMDELADKAGRDPLEFRLSHLEDDRGIVVINKIREMTLHEVPGDGEGIGYSFCRYKNSAAYAAVAAKVQVDQKTGKLELRKLWAAVDVGEVINLDGIKNQIEGGMIQAVSWTLKEQVTFSDDQITSTDWIKYPILRFTEIPEVEVSIIDRPEQPAEGGGEVSMPPTGAAIANAVYRACGKRVYDLPITEEKLKI
ncbi:MAG: molybdopterin cofactor-binding domain-containing protein [Bacteroidota bacterium]